jgi:hypothetical protein
VNLLWRRKGEFTSEFVRWFLFLFFYWPHSHLCECATDFPISSETLLALDMSRDLHFSRWQFKSMHWINIPFQMLFLF